MWNCNQRSNSLS